MTNIIKNVRGLMRRVTKATPIRDIDPNSVSIFAKRRLDFSYKGFISSAKRPPLASPSLAENCGGEHDVAVG